MSHRLRSGRSNQPLHADQVALLIPHFRDAETASIEPASWYWQPDRGGDDLLERGEKRVGLGVEIGEGRRES
jgi:hypothetical protein